MWSAAKRINGYLNAEDHELVSERAARAGMKTSAYLRWIARGVLPVPKTKDFVIRGLALVANELDTAASHAEEKTSKRAMVKARDRLRNQLKQHLEIESAHEVVSPVVASVAVSG